MQTFASQLAADAKKNGLEKAAAARGLHVVTTDYLAKDGVIAGVADGSGLLTQAFTVVKGADPASVSTGDGFAVFQVQLTSELRMRRTLRTPSRTSSMTTASSRFRCC